MSQRLSRLVAIVVAGVVVLAGAAYAFGRAPTYESRASIVLTPATDDLEEASSVIEAFERSGTTGTHVELLASADTKAAAGDPPVDILVRAIPDSRVIQVSAQGPDDEVRSGLRAVISAADKGEAALKDGWSSRILQQPTAPEQVGPSPVFVLGSAVLLALLAALAVLVLGRRLAPGAGPQARGRDPWEQDVTTDLTREPRTPTLR